MIRRDIRRAFQLALRRRDHWEHEVEEEIKLHLALRAEALVAQGATPDDAYQRAVQKFGPIGESRARMLDAARHREQRMQRVEYLSDLRQDLVFALRTLKRDKGWTSVAVLTLALGIAASTAVFSAVSSLLLHPLPYPHADRVVIVLRQPLQGNKTGINVAIVPNNPVIRAWKANAHSFEALEAVAGGEAELRTRGEPVTLTVARVEPTFPTFAGFHPIVGRMFTQGEITSRAHTVVLSEGLWRSRFGADPAVLGRVITLDDSTYTIVGVLPARLIAPSFNTSTTDLWMPLDLRDDRGGATVVGRLAPGRDAPTAGRELDSIAAHVANQAAPKFATVVDTPAHRVQFRDSLLLLSYAVGLLLLVACANVAHLLVARSTSRRREVAIRVALGAGRSRVFRQLLTESVLLGVFGGALGVLGGWLGLRAIVALRPPDLAELELAHLDATTLAAALAVTMATSLVFGLIGLVQAARTSTHDALKTGAGGSLAPGRGRARQLLVVTEMAISATLVVGASMLVRSVSNLQHANLGFEPKHLYSLGLTSARKHFANAAAEGAFARDVATRLAKLPGVASVALTSTPPGWFAFSIGSLEIEGEPAPPAGTSAFINVNQIGSGYFTTMGVRLVEGSAFTDTSDAAHQVIINANFARKHWPGGSPLGKRLRVSYDGKEPWLTIVRVAADAATGGPAFGESTEPYLYTPAADSVSKALLVRTDGRPILGAVQSLVRSLDGHVSPKLTSIETQISNSIAAPKFVMVLLAVFTALALALAAVGLYGVLAYAVAQRTREIGIRMALGASQARIARSVVIRGVMLAAVGAAAGIALSIWGTRLIEHELFGVGPRDVVSFAASLLVLLAAAVLACVVPTRRALAVDPMTAIRAE